MSDESRRIPETPGHREPPRTLGAAILQIGPGLILAGAIVGTGELIATTNAGAKAGFALLWLVLLSCFIKVFAQVELGRYAVGSGRGTFRSFRDLPGPGLVLVWTCVVMILFTQMQIGAMIGGIARAAIYGLGASVEAHPLFGDTRAWAVLVTAITVAMLSGGSYRLVERVSTVLVAGFTLMTVACVALLPADFAVHASDLAEGFKFQIPADAWVVAFTMFGITGVGASELLAYPYWCIEKGYARYVGPRDGSTARSGRARGWMRILLLDAWISMAVYTVATLAFYLLGASVVNRIQGGNEIAQGELLPTLASMYAPVLGSRGAVGMVVAGAICVLYSTLFASSAGSARILADALGVSGAFGPGREDLRRRWVRGFCVGLPILGLILFLSFDDLIFMVKVGGMMQGLTLPLIGAAALLLRYRNPEPGLKPGLVWDGFLWLSLVGLTGAACYTIWSASRDLWAIVAAHPPT